MCRTSWYFVFDKNENYFKANLPKSRDTGGTLGRCPFCVPEWSEDFYKMGNYEDKIYSLNDTVPGQTQAVSQAVQKTLENKVVSNKL